MLTKFLKSNILFKVYRFLVIPLLQELKGGKAYAKVSLHMALLSTPHHLTSRSPRFTVISHIYVDCHVSP